MPHSSDTVGGDTDLRKRALAKLSVGPLKEHKRASTADALAALHRLASAPSTAVDAMALLHEMQVHQVELDLQQEELGRSRAELEAALVRQTALIERAPVGYMTIDAGTVVYEINLAGARLLGAAQDDLLGRPLAGLLSAHSADVLQKLLARARDGLHQRFAAGRTLLQRRDRQQRLQRAQRRGGCAHRVPLPHERTTCRIHVHPGKRWNARTDDPIGHRISIL